MITMTVRTIQFSISFQATVRLVAISFCTKLFPVFIQNEPDVLE